MAGSSRLGGAVALSCCLACLPCCLSAFAWGDRDQRLHVVVAFVPEGGEREAVARNVNVPAPGRRAERPNRSS